MSGIVGGVGSNSGLVGRNEAEYETGTFEPSFGTSASHGSNTIALSYSYGFYVKVGHRSLDATVRGVLEIMKNSVREER